MNDQTTPEFGTAAYWRAVSEGRIGWADAERQHQDRQARRDRAQHARTSGSRSGDPRADRPAPEESRQYAREMATRAFRDDRLTSGAKALLAIIVAECGDHAGRILAKGYLARRIKRSTRTIQRYLRQLRQYGYIAAEAVRNRSGWQTGQRLSVTGRALPFWHPINRRACRVVERLGETELSPTKAYGLKPKGTWADPPSRILPMFRDNSGAALVGPQVRPLGPLSG